MKTIITLEVENGDVKVLSTEVVESEVMVEEEVEEIEEELQPELSVYGRRFDMTTSRAWSSDAGYNLIFLSEQNGLANDILKSQGYLFLNDVYGMLGLPKTKAGQVVGWIYDTDLKIDNRVDFGLGMECNEKFGLCNYTDAWLDFNVDGEILDRIESFTE